jgi:hypothetical protein
MAAASESNDASDIFWPGYVDAVTNLAINLLFVIAVMSIVVLSTVLQISKLQPEDYVPKLNDVTEGSTTVTTPSITTAKEEQQILDNAQQIQKALVEYKTAAAQLVDPSSANEQPSTETPGRPEGATGLALEALLAALEKNNVDLAPGKLEKLVADKTTAERLAAEQQKAVEALQKELQALKAQREQQQQLVGKATALDGTTATLGDIQVLSVTQNKQATQTGVRQIRSIDSGGLVLVFGNDVIELSDEEANQMATVLAAGGPIAQGRWRVQVFSPKGFSEATRLAYYRVNSVRNQLLKRGVPAESIEMRVTESTGANANNARVLVRPAQP